MEPRIRMMIDESRPCGAQRATRWHVGWLGPTLWLAALLPASLLLTALPAQANDAAVAPPAPAQLPAPADTAAPPDKEVAPPPEVMLAPPDPACEGERANARMLHEQYVQARALNLPEVSSMLGRYLFARNLELSCRLRTAERFIERLARRIQAQGPSFEQVQVQISLLVRMREELQEAARARYGYRVETTRATPEGLLDELDRLSAERSQIETASAGLRAQLAQRDRDLARATLELVPVRRYQRALRDLREQAATCSGAHPVKPPEPETSQVPQKAGAAAPPPAPPAARWCESKPLRMGKLRSTPTRWVLCDAK